MLALKGNQGSLLEDEDVKLYFTDGEFLEKSAYKKTIEKAREKGKSGSTGRQMRYPG